MNRYINEITLNIFYSKMNHTLTHTLKLCIIDIIVHLREWKNNLSMNVLKKIIFND